MNNTKWAQRLFAGVLLVAWLGYAAINMVQQMPALGAAFRRGWDFESRIETVEQAANGSFLSLNLFQDINGYKNLLTNSAMLPVGGDLQIIRGEDGYLYYSNNFPYESYDFSDQALLLREVQSVVQDSGGSLLFVNCPHLYVEGLTQSDLPVSNLNARSNAFLYALKGYGIASLDARRVLTESELPPQQYRYKTEPHWTTQASFEVYIELLNWMYGQESSSADSAFLTDRSNYRQTTYENAFSGQMGKRIGIPYAGYDDFTLIEPGFDTRFTLHYDEKGFVPPKQGDFASVLLDMHWMEQADPYQRSPYNAYLTSLYSYRRICNELNPDGPRILVIGDTYMLPVASLLATAAGELHLLWPYGLPDMDEDVKTLLDYIEKYDFDHVIVGMSPDSMYEGGFNFLAGVGEPRESLSLPLPSPAVSPTPSPGTVPAEPEKIETPSGIVIETRTDVVVAADGTVALGGDGWIRSAGAELLLPAGSAIAPDGTIAIGAGGAIITNANGKQGSLPEGLQIVLEEEAPFSFSLTSLPFTDIPESAWYFDNAAFAYLNGLFVGTDEASFSPQQPMTYGMLVTVLGRLEGLDVADSGADVDDGTDRYDAPYVAWASELGLLAGVEGIGLDAGISRQNLAIVLYNYASATGITLPETETAIVFTDNGSIAGRASAAVAAMQRAGIFHGKPGGGFDPTGLATRAEVAVILHRFCAKRVISK